ncbi:unnamed protein product [Absidia cylindrospora]
MTLAEYFECTIDFEGQRLAENLTYYILISAFLIGFITGYALESMQLTLAIFGIGFVAACLFAIPPWPMYRRHPVPWIEATKEGKESSGAASTESTSS